MQEILTTVKDTLRKPHHIDLPVQYKDVLLLLDLDSHILADMGACTGPFGIRSVHFLAASVLGGWSL